MIMIKEIIFFIWRVVFNVRVGIVLSYDCEYERIVELDGFCDLWDR